MVDLGCLQSVTDWYHDTNLLPTLQLIVFSLSCSTLCSGLAFILIFHLTKRWGWVWLAQQMIHDRGNRSQMGSMWMFPVCLVMIKVCYVTKEKVITEIEIIIKRWGFLFIWSVVVIKNMNMLHLLHKQSPKHFLWIMTYNFIPYVTPDWQQTWLIH